MVSDRDPAIRTGTAFAMATDPANAPKVSAIVTAMLALSYMVTGALCALALPEIVHRVQVVVAQWH